MAIYEIEYGGRIYEVDATSAKQAEEDLGNYLGLQAAEAMQPGPDMGTEPVAEENRFGDTTSKAMEQPLALAGYGMGRAVDTNLPIGERAKGFGTAGLGMLGAGAAGAAGLAAETLAPLTNPIRSISGALGFPQPKLDPQTAERRLASDLMMGMEVGIPELAGVGSGVARMTKQAAVPKVVPTFRGYGDMTERMDVARAAEASNVLPSSAMQSGGLSLVEAGLESLPISAGTIQRNTQRVIDEGEARATELARRAGNVGATESAGGALKSGAETYVADFNRKSKALYQEVDKFIRKDDLVVAPNTAQMLKDLSTDASLFPQLEKEVGLNKYRSLLTDFQQDGIDVAMPYELLKRVRSKIGESIGKIDGPLSSMGQGDLKRLYGAITEDMRVIAESSGPEATKAWNRANNFYAAGSTRIEDTINKILKPATDQGAYKAVSDMLREGNSKQSTKTLLNIKKSLPKDDFDQFRATLIDNLGRPSGKAEGFSPSYFVSGYEKMAPQSRRLVFGELDSDLGQLAKTMQKAKEAGVDINRSRTGNVVTLSGAVFLASSGSLYPVLVAAGINYAGAKGLTNKRFLKAMNAAAKKDMGPLQRIAAGDGILAPEASTILRSFAAQEANIAE